jgi:ankyrin repeat protein
MDPIAAFKDAVQHEDASALCAIFTQAPELKSKIDDALFMFDCPAIVVAGFRGNLDLITALLDAGANIHARSQWWAGSFGVLDHDHHEIVPFLIERGATVDAHAAARHGMIDRLRELVHANPAAVHARGGDGQTPLHVASSTEIAAFLLDHGADIDARDIDHESTPAQYLIRKHPEIVRYLIGRGCKTDILLAAAVGDLDLVRRHLDADPESIRTRVNEKYFPMQNPRAGGAIYTWTLGPNRSPHQAARSFGHPAVLQFLLDRTPEDLKLGLACAAADAPTAKAFYARDPDKAREYARANAHYISDAAEDNDIEAVRLMLECGWPVEGDGRHTPLHWACWRGNAEMAREILRYHPPLEFRDADYNATPWGWAIHSSRYGPCRDSGDVAATIQALRDAGAAPPE